MLSIKSLALICKAFLLSLNLTLKQIIMKSATWYGDIVIGYIVHGFKEGGTGV